MNLFSHLSKLLRPSQPSQPSDYHKAMEGLKLMRQIVGEATFLEGYLPDRRAIHRP